MLYDEDKIKELLTIENYAEFRREVLAARKKKRISIAQEDPRILKRMQELVSQGAKKNGQNIELPSDPRPMYRTKK